MVRDTENTATSREGPEAHARLARAPFCILDWTIDAANGRIHCDDAEIKLEPKVMEVLIFLASRAGGVVTRAELEENVWDQVVVSYETLTSTIQKLRKAFNDDARDPRIIETLSKRGYRLIAPVTSPVTKDGAPVLKPAPRQRSAPQLTLVVLALAIGLGGILLAVRYLPPAEMEARLEKSSPPLDVPSVQPLSAKPSIAVLPFVNLSNDKEQEYFSDGMSEDLITDLSKISGLLVVARNSTFAYKGQSIDVRTVARDLGVRYIVEGSLRKTGGRVRINAQLINAETGMHIWADRYDRDLKDLFALQEDVRQKIVAALKLKLTGTDKRRLARKGTSNVAAYDLFMRGREFESRFNPEGLAEALRLYGQAINIDPNFSDAYARMANVHGVHLTLGLTDDVAKIANTAIRLAERAVELDGESPFAHWSLGQILARHVAFSPRNFARSLNELERAIEIDANYADAYAQLSYNYASAGRLKAALHAIETAMRLNPHYPFWYLTGRGNVHFLMGNYETAITAFEAAAERNPTVSFVRWRLAAAYAQIGRIEDAKWETEELRNNGFNKGIDVVLRTMALQRPVDIQRYREGLLKAGLPERSP